MNEHAQALGRLGGRARAQSTSADQRKAWARKAGKASGKARAKRIQLDTRAVAVQAKPISTEQTPN